MKKIIILTIATLSTGIVLSSSLKKNSAVVVKPVVIVQKEEITAPSKYTANTSYNVVAQAD